MNILNWLRSCIRKCTRFVVVTRTSFIFIYKAFITCGHGTQEAGKFWYQFTMGWIISTTRKLEVSNGLLQAKAVDRKSSLATVLENSMTYWAQRAKPPFLFGGCSPGFTLTLAEQTAWKRCLVLFCWLSFLLFFPQNDFSKDHKLVTEWICDLIQSSGLFAKLQ